MGPFQCKRVEFDPFQGFGKPARRHRGLRAASWALSMLAAGKRRDGRWAYPKDRGTAKPYESKDSFNYKTRHQCGVIADYAPDLLKQVRDDGRWERNSITQNSGLSEKEMYRVCGVIADHAPDLLKQVRDDGTSLNAAHVAGAAILGFIPSNSGRINQ